MLEHSGIDGSEYDEKLVKIDSCYQLNGPKLIFEVSKCKIETEIKEWMVHEPNHFLCNNSLAFF